jgi:hypothetical protein
LIVLLLIAGAAVGWRLTLGTHERLGQLAEAGVSSGGDPDLAKAMERQAEDGSGIYDADLTVSLLERCRDATARKLQRYAYREFDAGIDYANAYLYSHTYRGTRYVGASPEANEYGPLQLPLSGQYVVTGYVRYSSAPFSPSAGYHHSLYTCEVEIKGTDIDVGAIELKVVR